MNLKPITVLRRGRKLIAHRDNWIKGAFIGKRKGLQCYCGLGAVAIAAGIKVAGRYLLDPQFKLPEVYHDAQCLLTTASGTVSFQRFNDARGTKHADVLAVFDKAIELAKV